MSPGLSLFPPPTIVSHPRIVHDTFMTFFPMHPKDYTASNTTLASIAFNPYYSPFPILFLLAFAGGRLARMDISPRATSGPLPVSLAIPPSFRLFFCFRILGLHVLLQRNCAPSSTSFSPTLSLQPSLVLLRGPSRQFHHALFSLSFVVWTSLLNLSLGCFADNFSL